MTKTKFKKILNNPIKAISLLNRRYIRLFRISDDKYTSYVHSWIYGKIKRKSMDELFCDKAPEAINLMKPFSNVLGMSMTINEMVSLVGLIKIFNCNKILEIGTYDGGLTLNLAANTSDSAIIYTMDLPDVFSNFSLDIAFMHDNRSKYENIGIRYRNSTYNYKIKQIFADSASFDYTSLPSDFDTVIIDGCHDYSYVKSDTENAMKVLKKGGVLIWHDYGMIKDVTNYIDSLSYNNDINVITGTRIAFMKV